jgi:phage protein D
MPVAAWTVTLGGKDITSKIAPRLLTMVLTERRSGDVDELSITLDDSDGLLEIPARGVEIAVKLGWAQGQGVKVGMVDKGTYKVDQAGASGPPDIVTIKARSADFTGGFRIRKERSFVGHSVASIVNAIASDNGLKPRIDGGLGSKTIPALGSGPKSDAALLYELGQRFDAVATVKAGYLLFSPIGNGKTPAGADLATETFDRIADAVGTFDYDDADRGKYDGVEAVYHDYGSAQQHTVTSGHTGEGKAKRLRKVYPNASDAQHAADAEATRLKRSLASLRVTSLGRPDLFPNKGIKTTGYKSEINNHGWVVATAEHRVDGGGGFITSLTLEAGSTDTGAA